MRKYTYTYTFTHTLTHTYTYVHIHTLTGGAATVDETSAHELDKTLHELDNTLAEKGDSSMQVFFPVFSFSTILDLYKKNYQYSARTRQYSCREWGVGGEEDGERG